MKVQTVRLLVHGTSHERHHVDRLVTALRDEGLEATALLDPEENVIELLIGVEAPTIVKAMLVALGVVADHWKDSGLASDGQGIVVEGGHRLPEHNVASPETVA